MEDLTEAADKGAVKGGKLVALVVTYNRLAQLQTTVARLLAAGPADLAGVLVVDNASTDGTDDWLATQDDPRLQVLRLPENTGGAGGFAAGLRHALHAFDPDWLVLMDDDARPQPETFARFWAQDRDTQDVWIAATYFPDGSICEMNRPWLNPFGSWATFKATLRHGWAGYHLPDAAYEAMQPTAIDGASFVGYFISKAAAQLAGVPDVRLFIYADDVSYSLKLGSLGGRFAFDPGLRFEHDCAADMGTHPITPLWKVYYMYRNQLRVYRVAAGPVLFWPVALLKAVSWRRKARAYGADRKIYLTLWRRAVWHGVTARLEARFDQVRAWAGGNFSA